MAMQGNIRDMSIADIIQHNCTDRKVALLTVESNGNLAQIYFRDGAIVHAAMGSLTGEDVIYHVLSWMDGSFTMETDIKCDEVSIKRHWTNLLLEGAKRIDEYRNDPTGRLFGSDSPERRKEAVIKELNELLHTSNEFIGVAVVALDGGMSLFRFRETVDEKIVSAMAASCLNFGKRSLGLINKGSFVKAIIQGEQGNLIVTSINPHYLFLGLSSVNLNFQALMTESTQACAALSDLLQVSTPKIL